MLFAQFEMSTMLIKISHHSALKKEWYDYPGTAATYKFPVFQDKNGIKAQEVYVDARWGIFYPFRTFSHQIWSRKFSTDKKPTCIEVPMLNTRS